MWILPKHIDKSAMDLLKNHVDPNRALIGAYNTRSGFPRGSAAWFRKGKFENPWFSIKLEEWPSQELNIPIIPKTMGTKRDLLNLENEKNSN